MSRILGRILCMPIKKKLGEVTLEELLEAGAHFGHRVERWNPKIAPYVFGQKEGIHIFDLERTREKLLEAMQELKRRANLEETILFVGTKQQAQEVIRDTAQKVGSPYIVNRWIGGLLTNFAQIKKSIDKLSKMKAAREAGEYKKFTKKEQLLLDREIARLEKLFGGVASLSGLPDILIIVDIKKENTAVAEARRMEIPLMAIVDTNSDPTLVDYPIPANDDSNKSVSFVVGKLGEAIEEGLELRAKNKVKQVEEVSEVSPARSAESTASAGGQVSQV